MIETLFDANWYRRAYPDIAAAGVDPLQHYLRFGKQEGRWPCALPALELEQQLWQTAAAVPILQQLQQLNQAGSALHSALAAWVLARWYASFGQWPQARQYLPALITSEQALNLIGHQGPFLLAFATYFNCQQSQAAQNLLTHPAWPDSNDKLLARSMLLAGNHKLEIINTLFKRHQLTPLQLNRHALLDSLACQQVKNDKGQKWLAAILQPKVSIIMPCFNAAKTLATALTSLLAQSHQNLEILVVDDCSTDNSTVIAQQFAAQDPRVKLLRLPENRGAYVARNTALQQARGKYITTHDADDWSHPEKIARQLAVLRQQPNAMASVSHWVRCDNNLVFQRWRTEEAWIYRNVSSLMFRRKVLTTLGFWDCVSVNADTEYYYRILQQYGRQSIVEVLPGVPLSFGRADEGSLSQTKSSHLRTQFYGLRKNYHDAAIAWQQHSKNLYLAANPTQRPFAVPPAMCRGNSAQQQHNLALCLAQRSLFDPAWYQQRYPDIKAAAVDPLQHFVCHGAAEGRDPLATFSLTGYAVAHQLPLSEALKHWLSQPEPVTGPITLSGLQPISDAAPGLLLVGHSVSERLFGAERSFLDVLKILQPGPYRLIVTLPAASSASYVTSVQQYASSVIILPYSWWQQGKTEQTKVINAFSQLIQQYQIQKLYVNTLVLAEPLTAARQTGIPSVVHVRELLAHDPDLCALLGANAPTIRQSLLQRADYFIANSQAVANWLAAPARTTIVPNTLEPAAWGALPFPQQPPLQVAMLSSNLPKKGLDDFITVAQHALAQQLQLQFLLFGPQNEYLARYQAAGLPANIRVAGYAEQPQQALAQAHIVLNLSQFQESFGRSVLEAMAAGRVVVAYEWGALPELLTQQCGILVPYRDTAAVVTALARLAAQPELYQQLAAAAQQRAVNGYSPAMVAAKLHAALKLVQPHSGTGHTS